MINALGLLEVCGLTASIEAADAMLKAANVRLLSQTITPPGLITLVIEGDLAACRAALDAGSAAANRLGQVIARKEIGRPETDTEWFVSNFGVSQEVVKVSSVVSTSSTPTSVPVATTESKTTADDSSSQVELEDTAVSEATLLAFIAKHSQGRNVTDIISHFNATRAEIKKLLGNCISEGTIHKRGNRYYLVETKK